MSRYGRLICDGVEFVGVGPLMARLSRRPRGVYGVTGVVADDQLGAGARTYLGAVRVSGGEAEWDDLEPADGPEGAS